jgi:hypothetical protein
LLVDIFGLLGSSIRSLQCGWNVRVVGFPFPVRLAKYPALAQNVVAYDVAGKGALINDRKEWLARLPELSTVTGRCFETQT